MTIPFTPSQTQDARLIVFPLRRSNKDRLTVVVPCYNEAKRLQSDEFLTSIDTSPRIDLLFVNDGSSDDTLEKLQALAALRPDRIEVLNLPENRGKAEAVRAGLEQALASDADLVAYWDADLATPLFLIEDFLRIADRQSEIEVVFGSRRKMLGHRVERTFMRSMVSRICASLARLAIGLPIADTQCGAKMFRATPALKESVSVPFTAGWLFDVELLARVARRDQNTSARTRFYELPLSEWTEVPGSKVSARAILASGLRMLRLIFELRLRDGATDNVQRSQDPFRKAA